MDFCTRPGQARKGQGSGRGEGQGHAWHDGYPSLPQNGGAAGTLYGHSLCLCLSLSVCICSFAFVNCMGLEKGCQEQWPCPLSDPNTLEWMNEWVSEWIPHPLEDDKRGWKGHHQHHPPAGSMKFKSLLLVTSHKSNKTSSNPSQSVFLFFSLVFRPHWNQALCQLEIDWLNGWHYLHTTTHNIVSMLL